MKDRSNTYLLHGEFSLLLMCQIERQNIWDKHPDGMPVIMSDKMLDNITGFIPFWGSHTQF